MLLTEQEIARLLTKKLKRNENIHNSYSHSEARTQVHRISR